MAGKGFDDADKQPPLYLHTTEEMLQEFDYLGADKAFEIVVTNTNKIMNMCEDIDPVRPDKRPPVIENSDQMLRKICHDKAHELYGPELPEIVTERLERELNSIISYTDSQISDILHYIEFHKFSAAEGYKLCKKLQEICDRRREAKNKMQIINTMKIQSCASVLSGSATKRIEKIVPDKKYTPRVFDELFKKNQSRIRKEKSVKIKI